MQKLAPFCTHYLLLIQARDASFSLKKNTRCLFSLNLIFIYLFIVNGKKTISSDIENIISPRSLAFWAMEERVAYQKVAFILILSLIQ